MIFRYAKNKISKVAVNPPLARNRSKATRLGRCVNGKTCHNCRHQKPESPFSQSGQPPLIKRLPRQ